MVSRESKAIIRASKFDHYRTLKITRKNLDYILAQLKSIKRFNTGECEGLNSFLKGNNRGPRDSSLFRAPAKQLNNGSVQKFAL